MMKLDAFALTLASEVKAGDVIPVPLFPIGEWKSAKYPKLPLTRELADELLANFEASVLGTDPVIDSSGTHDNRTPASGWFKRVSIEPTKDGGELFTGWAELTDVGADDLNNGRYRYASVEIGPHVDNESGKTTAHVLKGATFTNAPVLRIMPAVLDTGEHLAASELCVALSELEQEDPVSTLVDEIDGLLGKLSETLKGKLGVPAMRTMLREVKAKASAHKLADLTLAEWDTAYINDLPDSAFAVIEDGGEKDDDGKTTPRSLRHFPIRGASGEIDADHVRNALSRLSQSTLPDGLIAKARKAIETAARQLGIGGRGNNEKKEKSMSEVTTLLKLSEDADEATVAEAVRKLAEKAERTDVVEAKLAEIEKTKRLADIDAAITATEVLPREKDTFYALAESAPETLASMLEARKGHKLVDLSEQGKGVGAQSGTQYENPTVELAEKAATRAKADKITKAEAQKLVLAEDPELKERVENWRSGKEA